MTISGELNYIYDTEIYLGQSFRDRMVELGQGEIKEVRESGNEYLGLSLARIQSLPKVKSVKSDIE